MKARQEHDASVKTTQSTGVEHSRRDFLSVRLFTALIAAIFMGSSVAFAGSSEERHEVHDAERRHEVHDAEPRHEVHDAEPRHRVLDAEPRD